MRTYKRKTDRGANPQNLEEALKAIIQSKFSIRKAASQINIPRQTLNKKFLELKKLCGGEPRVEDIGKISYGHKRPRQVLFWQNI